MLAQAAMLQWESVLGPENLITEREPLRAAATATFHVDRWIPAILRPATREQVQQTLRIASKFGVPVYPVSSGKNWGYGSRTPASDGCVLLDLSRMNRILDFNEDLGYVSVEPGVTQGQLFDFLRSRNSCLWIDATGSSPECSLIGNTIERGFGHTPYGDHFGNVCGFEIVLATGEKLETGAARFPGSPAAPVYRWGLGPSLDGLFTQSNFGVVTRMTFWLMPAPEYFQAFFFRCDEDEDLPAIIDALRRLRMSGTLRSAIHVGNDYKVLAGMQQYPWKETGGSTPLTPDQMGAFRRRMNFGAWNGSGGLYGTRAQVAEARRLLRRELAGKVEPAAVSGRPAAGAGIAILWPFPPDFPLGFEPCAGAGAAVVRLAKGPTLRSAVSQRLLAQAHTASGTVGSGPGPLRAAVVLARGARGRRSRPDAGFFVFSGSAAPRI